MDARNVLFAKGTFGDPIHRRRQYDQLEQEILENPQLKQHEVTKRSLDQPCMTQILTDPDTLASEHENWQKNSSPLIIRRGRREVPIPERSDPSQGKQ